jgi:aconitate decarboxylase
MANSEFGETLDQLAAYLTTLDYGDIPAAVIDREKAHILDTLGCILYGSTTPWVRKVVRACDRLGESGPVSILGRDASMTPARAVLINGTASHSMDYDDHCQEAGIHAGSATLPAAMAYAETADRTVSGRELLTAVVAGVEIGIRSGFGIGYGSVGRGWHIAGWTGAFAAAATTSKLYRLDHEQTAHALAVAGTQGCGLLGAQYGAEVKRFHMGKAAEAGYLGTMLAREGFTGDTRIFQERYGAIGPTMSDDYDIAAVTEDLGGRYRLLDKLSLKPFPGVGQVHAPVDAVREIIDRENVDPADVTGGTVRTTATVKDHVGWEYEPTDVMAAQASIQYAVATLLVDGEVTIDAYTPAAIERPAVLERVEEISVVVDESLAETTFGSVVEVSTRNRTYENAVHTPRGYPSNFMTEAELHRKFRTQAEKAVPDAAVEALVDTVPTLEEVADVRTLLDHC